MSKKVYLVTGASGCIGSWVLRNLVDEGARIVAADLAEPAARTRLLLSDEEIDNLNWQRLDVTDAAAVAQVVESQGVTHVIHLAGLQIPFCKADPSRGAAVNVTGTVNLLDAARHNGIEHFSYASSVAAFGPDTAYPVKPLMDDAPLLPASLYGVYKQANEGTARVFWQDWQFGSVGLRPGVVYGVGRDQGLTSDLAKAVLAAAAGRPFRIRFNGSIALQYADDCAKMFIRAADAAYQGAATCNLRGDVIEVAEFVTALRQVRPEADIDIVAEPVLPFPSDLDDSGLSSIIGESPHTALPVAIEASLNRFENLLSAGSIDLSQLDD